MGKIGDLVNRLISPLLNRSTDSQTVADPRRGRIGYVGNITLISQLINDVGYSTSEGKVTNVDISAGKFERWQDIAPADDELIPKFNVPTSTSHLDNDVHYGTGTITGLTGSGNASVSTSDNIATVTIKWKNEYYGNVETKYTKNKGNLITLYVAAGTPDDTTTGINLSNGRCNINIPTHTSHLINNDYITTNSTGFADINTTKSIAIATASNYIFEEIDASTLTQEQINTFKLYKCGNMYTFFGQYVKSSISANPGYTSLFTAKGLYPGFATTPNRIVIGNGIARWVNSKGHSRATPIVITCTHANYTQTSEIGMFICTPSTGSFPSTSYTIYISGTIFSDRGPT